MSLKFVFAGDLAAVPIIGTVRCSGVYARQELTVN